MEDSINKPRINLKKYIAPLAGAIVFLLVYLLLFTAPSTFGKNRTVTIENGLVLSQISKSLRQQGIIRSEVAFEFFVILSGGEKRIVPGDYLFEKSAPVYRVAQRIITRDYGIEQSKVTLPEGLNRREMSLVLDSQLSNFDKDSFILLTKNDEGYLFPDTYFFFPRVTTEKVIETLKDTFNKKTSSLRNEAESSGKKFGDIITMASIIEKEATGENDRKIISGILWNRIAKKMALQADATLTYITGKESKDLTLNDLKINSPYNTYTNRGLPPTPISNPGLASIDAALHPTKSAYLYYLHDNKGNVYYAKTFEEHKANKAKYLN